MTATLISLVSIFIGIIGANLTGFIFRKYSFGLVGNTIAGVFGSILFIKSFGRFGFDPVSIMQTGSTYLPLFFLNCLVSFLGGAMAVILMKKIKETMDSKKSNKEIMTNLFKITSFLEGVSYILLLFVGVPLKYFGDNPILVKSLGMPHGMLFLAYIVMALLIRGKMNWDAKTTFGVLIASILPFGTFYINKKHFGRAI
ncbi:MAG: DUF3817 domain-containing protein [Saprospiraceae bacterium]